MDDPTKNEDGSAENIIPFELIKQESDFFENMENVEIDEVFPKVEEVQLDEFNLSDSTFDDTRNLQPHNECNDGVNTDFTQPCLIFPEINVQPTATPSLMKIIDASSLHVRVCVSCSAIIKVKDYSNISWQARDFCNEQCLTKYQIRFNSFCVQCKRSIVDSNTFGKYFMKFGNNVRAFCSKHCGDKYKVALNMCQFCNNGISNNAHCKYLAPATENSFTFRQFCSINCVQYYCHYKLKLPYQKDLDTSSYAHCFVCRVLKFIRVKFQRKDNLTFMFCSETCFVQFQCCNKTDAVQCCICKILYEKTFFQKYCLYDNGTKNFCSQNCETTYYIISRYIVECNNCKVTKYNFDMIQKTFPSNQTIYTCSFQCLKNSYRNLPRSNISGYSQNEFNRFYGNLRDIIKLSIAREGELAVTKKKNVSTICFPIQKNASTSTEPEINTNREQKSTQTRTIGTNVNILSAILPTPVPIYVPTPVPYGQVPVPVGIPVPVPIPVPIFIPTGCRTQEEITVKINRIREELPQDPLQADLIILAKTLNTETEAQGNKPTTSSGSASASTSASTSATISAPTSASTSATTNASSSANATALSKLKRKRKPETIIKKKVVIKTFYSFGFNALKQWIIATNKQIENDPSNLKDANAEGKFNLIKTNILCMTRDELHKCLIAFLEAIKSSSAHSSDIIYTIFLDIQKYLLLNNKKEYIFVDPSFKNFIENFNEITIHFHNNFKIKSKLTEDYLWKTNQLGTHTPYVLLNSLIYFNIKLFRLKTLQEHLDLLSIQISFYKKAKFNRPEGKQKSFYRFKFFPKPNNGNEKKNLEIVRQCYDRKRCPGVLYEFYMNKCPNTNIVENSTKDKGFYLKPELACETDSPIWFSNETLDEWTIKMMFNRIRMIKEINEM